jgi:hypothetical protein
VGSVLGVKVAISFLGMVASRGSRSDPERAKGTGVDAQ